MNQKQAVLLPKLLIVIGGVVVVGVLAVFLRMSREPEQQPPLSEGACRPTGCSSQVCADTDVVTTCEFKPEYACYKKASCERQKNGSCGWTRTEEFESCMAGVLEKTYPDAPEVAKHADAIRIKNIAPNVIVVSPLYLKGEALGEWFSGETIEARLVDANGLLLASGAARAEGPVKDKEFVTFSVQFEFSRPNTDTGFAVFERKRLLARAGDEDTFEFPIRFR